MGTSLTTPYQLLSTPSIATQNTASSTTISAPLSATIGNVQQRMVFSMSNASTPILTISSTSTSLATVPTATKESIEENTNNNVEMDFQRALTSQLGVIVTSNSSAGTFAGIVRSQTPTPSYNSIAGTYSTISSIPSQQQQTNLQGAALPIRTSATSLNNQLYNVGISTGASQINNGTTTTSVSMNNINIATVNNLTQNTELSNLSLMNNINSSNTKSTGYTENDLNQSTLMQVLKMAQNSERNTQPQTVKILLNFFD